MNPEYIEIQKKFFRRRIANYKVRMRRLRRRRRIILWTGLPPSLIMSLLSAITTMKVLKDSNSQLVENMAALGDLLPAVSANIPIYLLSLVIIFALMFSLLLQIREDEIDVAKHGIGKCEILHLLSEKEQKEMMVEINQDKQSLIKSRSNFNVNIIELIKNFLK